MEKAYPQSEKNWVFRLLILVAGFYGGYTMVLRGGVFSNAQTGNVALLAIALGSGNWMTALYYLVPLGGYLLGTIVSEVLPAPLGKTKLLRWSTLLILFEIVAVIVMGFIPVTAPHQICQILINFICAMQFNTFRQAEGIPMSTIFCSNLVRQMGIGLAGLLDPRKDKKAQLHTAWLFTAMVLCFAAGALGATVSCAYLGTYAIWLTVIPLAYLFASLLRADIAAGRDLAYGK